jgi:tRNA(Leu) C34 or U34 (ribose-2'-O)-methylase TrmL
MTKRDSRKSRGYCGIGIFRGKTEANVGTLWRSAFCLGADFIFTIGARYKKQSSDTAQAYRHIPLWEFADFEDFRNHIPYDCQLIGVELCEQAKSLERFTHPERAIYLLGPEDGSLPMAVIDLCQHIVKFSSSYCLNVASAGTVVLYDRQTKTAVNSAL